MNCLLVIAVLGLASSRLAEAGVAASSYGGGFGRGNTGTGRQFPPSPSGTFNQNTGFPSTQFNAWGPTQQSNTGRQGNQNRFPGQNTNNGGGQTQNGKNQGNQGGRNTGFTTPDPWTPTPIPGGRQGNQNQGGFGITTTADPWTPDPWTTPATPFGNTGRQNGQTQNLPNDPWPGTNQGRQNQNQFGNNQNQFGQNDPWPATNQGRQNQNDPWPASNPNQGRQNQNQIGQNDPWPATNQGRQNQNQNDPWPANNQNQGRQNQNQFGQNDPWPATNQGRQNQNQNDPWPTNNQGRQNQNQFGQNQNQFGQNDPWPANNRGRQNQNQFGQTPDPWPATSQTQGLPPFSQEFPTNPGFSLPTQPGQFGVPTPDPWTTPAAPTGFQFPTGSQTATGYQPPQNNNIGRQGGQCPQLTAQCSGQLYTQLQQFCSTLNSQNLGQDPYVTGLLSCMSTSLRGGNCDNAILDSLVSARNPAQNCLARQADQFTRRPQLCTFLQRNEAAFITALNVFGPEAPATLQKARNYC